MKETNRLVSKGMLNIYLKFTIETSSKLRLFEFKNFVTFWGAPTRADIIEFYNFLLQRKNQRSGSKSMCGFSIILVLKGIMTF